MLPLPNAGGRIGDAVLVRPNARLRFRIGGYERGKPEEKSLN
jgi:hypothetical protein